MSQPKMEGLDSHTIYFLGLALLGWGLVFVLSSFYALGFTGTFLGKTRRYGMTVGKFTGAQGGAESSGCCLLPLACLENHGVGGGPHLSQLGLSVLFAHQTLGIRLLPERQGKTLVLVDGPRVPSWTQLHLKKALSPC